MQKFKTECKSRSFFREFGDDVSFKELFHRDLAKLVNSNVLRWRSEAGLAVNQIVNDQGNREKSVVELSEKEQILLRTAAETTDGQIMVRRVMNGQSIIVNNLNFGDGNPREFAAWRHALEQLDRKELVKRLNDTFFELTHLGWEYGGKLSENNSAG